MVIDEVLKEAKNRLKEVAERPLFEAEILLSHFLKVDRVYLHLNYDTEIDDLTQFFKLIERRANFEPIEYITNEVSFYSRKFKIYRGVLIPRPETEELIKNVIPYIKSYKNIVEIGTGSGVIAITLAKLLNKEIIACDVNNKAIELAKENALLHNVDKKIKFIESDMLERIYTSIEVIISNPPYISDSFKIDKNLTFEPKNSLFGGKRGDEFIQKLIDISIERGIKLLACEIGYDQKGYIIDYLKSKNINLERVIFYKDLNNLDRGFIVRFE